MTDFFVAHLKGGPLPWLQSKPDLSIIDNEVQHARASHWDFTLPGLNERLYSPCWQIEIKMPYGSHTDHDPIVHVLVTSSGKWAIMGTETRLVINRGDGRRIGGVPWVYEPERFAPEDYHLEILDTALTRILEVLRPRALAAYAKVRDTEP